jgi:chromosome segregation ATPase
MSVELDSFTEVKAAMDKMMADLKKQMEQEVQQKATCTQEFADNEKMTFEKTTLKEDLVAAMESLERKMKTLGEEIGAAKDELAATQEAIKEAGATREKENKQFQAVVADQRATQTVLNKALKRLEQFYKKGSLAQQDQTPPAQFGAYKKNAGSTSVLGLLEQIIEDSKKLEAETVATESKAQAEYETFVKDSNASVARLQEDVTAKSKQIEESKVEFQETSSDHQAAVGELESLAEYLADLHLQCDFLMKNFDVRQKARQEEIEAIQQAKSILSGA